jgi:hypothetical protein
MSMNHTNSKEFKLVLHFQTSEVVATTNYDTMRLLSLILPVRPRNKLICTYYQLASSCSYPFSHSSKDAFADGRSGT